MIARNITLFKWDNFFAGLFPLSTMLVIYFETLTHSYALAMSVLSLTCITTMIMEIPAGIISDKIGRKKTMITLGCVVFFCVLSWALAGQLNQVFLLFLGGFLMGISDAFFSGTDEALMYETMEELGRPDEYDTLFSKSRGYNQVGLALSALSAAFILYFFSLQILAWISVFSTLASWIVAFFYIEPKRSAKPKHTTSFKQFRIALRQLLRNKKARFYALIEMVDTGVGFATFRFESVYYETLLAKWVINVVRFVKQISGIISFFYIVPRVKKWGKECVFFSSLLGNIVLRFIGLISNNFLSPFIMAMTNLFYGTGQTSSSVILQQEFSPQCRATMKSIVSFGTQIFMAASMYLCGVLADMTNPWIVMFCALVVKVIVLSLSLMILKKSRQKLIHGR